MKPDHSHADNNGHMTWPRGPSVLKRFPSPRPVPSLSEELRASGIELLPATAADIPRLRALYQASRLAELLTAPWPADRKRAFLDDQFALQHDHFLKVYRKGDYRLIRLNDGPIGRIYFDRSGRDWALIDILLAAESRGKGIGSALIRWLQQSAVATGAERLRLHVARDNPRARKLYECLGFLEIPVASATSATHTAMDWSGNRALAGAQLR